ncbi:MULTISPECIES: Fic/DOC family N-terminal domain-containing protein [Gammaproteobacteria]|uniref:Fic family protein n=1 Tax=Gammaproteobacteria TaxID=1236 RepID=UPI000795AC92|nr:MULTISPECIES: Fic/DOC family N-terminal domain-containing protein [Gammaproteobacteria]KXJ47667.1 MAG: cell filamentation protein Fic [Marinobacter sp. Hex_13]MBQ26204.1 cell filamentation protein Fic [Alcanivorax sp.]|tara:strand:- start:390 stop:1517 length:1128 start_codon:yes stop_codon:yes gene_type:complete
MEPYRPQDLPLADIDYAQLITLVGEANAKLAEYSGLLQGIVNPAVMLSPLTQQEAVLSSKIEGTQATVEEVLEREAGQNFDDRKNEDINEILNYRKAMMLSQEHLKDGRPITLNLLLQLHAILLDSVRGQHKAPGEFRREQNWIGRPGCSIEQASFVPPNPLQLESHLQQWEQYLQHNDFDVLAQTAIVHAQFELLHPFKDGNGRIGRLLIPLFLYARQRLSSPMFYLSDYLEAHRDEYYQRLSAISAEGDWTGWIQFFLRAVIQQARTNLDRVRRIMALYEETKAAMADITHSQHSPKLLDGIFDRPIFSAGDFARRTGINKQTLHGLLRQLVQETGPLIILQEGQGRRPSIYAFPALLNICEGRDIFPATQNA